MTYEELIADRQHMVERIRTYVGSSPPIAAQTQSGAFESVHRIIYSGKDSRLDSFQAKFGALLTELDAARRRFDWSDFAERLATAHGIRFG